MPISTVTYRTCEMPTSTVPVEVDHERALHGIVRQQTHTIQNLLLMLLRVENRLQVGPDGKILPATVTRNESFVL